MEAAICIVIGLLAGISGGLFGIGGGIVIVPAMVAFLGVAQTKAQGTSLAVLLAPVGIFGVLNYHRAGNVDYRVAALIAGGFLLGAFLGSKVAVGLDPQVMRRAFAVFLALVAVWMFVRA